MADGPSLHPDVAHLDFLLGTWKGKGAGSYATIDDFSYLEVASFSHAGKPFLSYMQRTSDASTDAPLHAETGYLRPVGTERAELLVVQPSGVMELHDVEISGTALRASTSQVVCAPTAKSVEHVLRVLEVSRNELQYQLHMAAVGEPEHLHLQAVLNRD